MPLSPLLPGFSSTQPSQGNPLGPITLRPQGVPAGSDLRDHYRQFVNKMDGATELLSNLAANPAVYASQYWTSQDFGLMLQDTTSSILAQYDTCVTKAAALSPVLKVFPGLRTIAGAAMEMPNGTAENWCTTSWWELLVTKWRILLDRRVNGDPRIMVDSEAYGGDEINRASLAAAGKGINEFIRAVDPLIRLFATSDPVPVVCIHPQVLGDADHVNLFTERLIQVLGRDNVEITWEGMFGISEQYRRDPHCGYIASLCAHLSARAKFERNVGVYGLIHRVLLDDDAIQRTWGQAWRTAGGLETLGPMGAACYDGTRADQTAWGTPNGAAGLTLNTLNDVDFVFAWPRTYSDAQVAAVASSGQGVVTTAAPFKLTAGTVSSGYSPLACLDGLKLNDPGGGQFACIRIETVLPTVVSTPFTIDASFVLPTGWTVDFPLMGSCQYNSAVWQVYCDVSTGKLMLQTKKTSSTFDEFDLGVTVTEGQTVRVQIGRSGNTWLYSAGSAAINRTDIGYSVGVLSTGLLVLGAGLVPANFPLDNQQFGVPNIILPSTRTPSGSRTEAQLHVWKSRLISDSEITTKLRGEYWPFGYYT